MRVYRQAVNGTFDPPVNYPLSDGTRTLEIADTGC